MTTDVGTVTGGTINFEGITGEIKIFPRGDGAYDVSFA